MRRTAPRIYRRTAPRIYRRTAPRIYRRTAPRICCAAWCRESGRRRRRAGAVASCRGRRDDSAEWVTYPRQPDTRQAGRLGRMGHVSASAVTSPRSRLAVASQACLRGVPSHQPFSSKRSRNRSRNGSPAQDGALANESVMASAGSRTASAWISNRTGIESCRCDDRHRIANMTVASTPSPHPQALKPHRH